MGLGGEEWVVRRRVVVLFVGMGLGWVSGDNSGRWGEW